MPSPFPGMDPYLEESWGDVHTRLVNAMAVQLQRRLPGDLRARMEERLIIADVDDSRFIIPDVHIIEKGTVSRRPSHDSGGIAIAEPLVVTLSDEEETYRWIEIRTTGRPSRVVTVIELLSPTNKRGGRDEYLSKQRDCLRSHINLVEIDLLRTGDWTVSIPRALIHRDNRGTYRVVVRAGQDRQRGLYYPIHLDQPLPVVSIPLRPEESPVPLQLQNLIEQVYDEGAYDIIDYTVDPAPPLSPADAKWIDQHLRKKGLRKAKKRK